MSHSYLNYHKILTNFKLNSKHTYFPLHRLAVLKSIYNLDSDRLIKLIHIEIGYINKPYFFDFINVLNNTQIIFLKKIIKNKNSGLSEETYELIKRKIDFYLIKNKNSTKVFFLGTFGLFHSEHLNLATLAYNHMRNLDFENPQIITIPQFININRVDTTKTYEERLNNIYVVAKKYHFLFPTGIPGDNFDGYNSNLFVFLSKLSGNKLYWLWGSDNLITFSNNARWQSHLGIFKYKETVILVSKRPSDKSGDLDKAIAVLKSAFNLSIHILPERHSVNNIDISSSYLIKKIKTRRAIEKYLTNL